MKLSNGVEKYEIEVTKMGQNYSLFLTVCQHWEYSLFHAYILSNRTHFQGMLCSKIYCVHESMHKHNMVLFTEHTPVPQE